MDKRFFQHPGERFRMKEKEFIEEHPGLKGKQYAEHEFDGNLGFMYLLTDIHETQIDKQKVREVIDKALKAEEEEGYMGFYSVLKKELGLI